MDLEIPMQGEAAQESTKASSVVERGSSKRGSLWSSSHHKPEEQQRPAGLGSCLECFGGLVKSVRPECCWSRSFAEVDPPVREFQPTFWDAVSQLGLAWRLYKFIRHEKRDGLLPWIDPFAPKKPHTNHGVPCGGLGCGSIGRGYRGAFNRFCLRPGRVEEVEPIANQFSVRVCLKESHRRAAGVLNPDFRAGEAQDAACCSCRQRSMSRSISNPDDIDHHQSPFLSSSPPTAPSSNSNHHHQQQQRSAVEPLSSWVPWHEAGVTRKGRREKGGQQRDSRGHEQQLASDALANTQYHGRFPRSWTEYSDVFGLGVHLVCKQVSPFIPHQYVDSCLPVSCFQWLIHNANDEPAEVSLMFTWQNEVRDDDGVRGGHCHRPFEGPQVSSGVLLHHSLPPDKTAQRDGAVTLTESAADPLTFGIAVRSDDGVEGSCCPVFDCNGTGNDIWRPFSRSGRLQAQPGDINPEVNLPVSREGERWGAGVCGKVTVPPRSSRRVTFALSWDMPVARFPLGHPWRRRYSTLFYEGEDFVNGGVFDPFPGEERGGLSTCNVAAQLCEYAMRKMEHWESEIEAWQRPVLDDATLPQWYKSALFNELYFLVEAGTLWTNGKPWKNNVKQPIQPWWQPLAAQALSAPLSVPSHLASSIKRRARWPLFAAWTTKARDPRLSLYTPPTSTAPPSSSVTPASPLSSQNSSPVLAPFVVCDNGGLQQKVRTACVVPTLADAEGCEQAHLMSLRRGNGTIANVGGGSDGDSDVHLCDIGDEKSAEPFGHFLYLEGLEYLMYNTYDVHFYASWALLALFPHLELSLQRDFARAVLREDEEERTYVYQMNHRGKRKEQGCVPHDMGGPGEAPLVMPNCYNLHHTDDWKDLPCKFLLQVWRDYHVTRDASFLQFCWPAIELCLKRTLRFVDASHGLIVHGGWPDHTYDAWSVDGFSAYTGGLWVAALHAYLAMVPVVEAIGGVDITLEVDEIRELQKRAEACWEDLLWDPDKQYFLYDNIDNNSVHSDQLAGIWYSRATGLPYAVNDDKVTAALKTVYEANVGGFQNGRWGAVNGMHPNLKSIDNSCIQSREVWTGVTYALAATMLQSGLDTEAFVTAGGIWQACWRDLGFWYQTPEAFDVHGRFRSLAYMRPLAIWAMQYEIDQRKNTQPMNISLPAVSRHLTPLDALIPDPSPAPSPTSSPDNRQIELVPTHRTPLPPLLSDERREREREREDSDGLMLPSLVGRAASMGSEDAAAAGAGDWCVKVNGGGSSSCRDESNRTNRGFSPAISSSSFSPAMGTSPLPRRRSEASCEKGA